MSCNKWWRASEQSRSRKACKLLVSFWMSGPRTFGSGTTTKTARCLSRKSVQSPLPLLSCRCSFDDPRVTLENKHKLSSEQSCQPAIKDYRIHQQPHSQSNNQDDCCKANGSKRTGRRRINTSKNSEAMTTIFERCEQPMPCRRGLRDSIECHVHQSMACVGRWRREHPRKRNRSIRCCCALERIISTVKEEYKHMFKAR
jgi:hypothetical protein